jgi:hypothetical protein
MGVGGDAGLAGFPRRRLRASLSSTSDARKSFHLLAYQFFDAQTRPVSIGVRGILPVLPAKSAVPSWDGGIRRLNHNPALISAGFEAWTVGEKVTDGGRGGRG